MFYLFIFFSVIFFYIYLFILLFYFILFLCLQASRSNSIWIWMQLLISWSTCRQHLQLFSISIGLPPIYLSNLWSSTTHFQLVHHILLPLPITIYLYQAKTQFSMAGASPRATISFHLPLTPPSSSKLPCMAHPAMPSVLTPLFTLSVLQSSRAWFTQPSLLFSPNPLFLSGYSLLSLFSVYNKSINLSSLSSLLSVAI